jgi:Domain of unknown function (DUF4340)
MSMTASIAVAQKRKRNLGILGAVTVLFVVLAILAVIQRGRELAPKFEPRPFFPGLAAEVNNLGDIQITGKNGTFHVHLTNRRWVIPEKNGFPADAAQIRQVAGGLAALETLEPKTARADWLRYIGLDKPGPKSGAVEVKLSDMAGNPMADILVGQMQGTPDDLGREMIYVRRPDESQSWLARGYLAPKPDAADWLDRGILQIGRERIKGATMTPLTGPAYTLSRDSKDDVDFKLLDMPKGRELSFAGAPDGVAGAVAGFTFDDVDKADGHNFSKAAQSVTHTFDGLDITVRVADEGKAHWAIVSASASEPKAQAEADKINAAVKGWAFKLSDDKNRQFTATRDALLKPLADKTQAKKP